MSEPAATNSYLWIPINSKEDLGHLINVISPEFDPRRVVERLRERLSGAVKGILVEGNYSDKDYRSTYYNFYAKKGLRYQLGCLRLHFFDGAVNFEGETLKLACMDGRPVDHYFGYMVLRPTGIATIGRSVLSPDIRSAAKGMAITAVHPVHLLGYKLSVQGFPSMDQHVDIAVCAHVACWAMLRHYSERYNAYREFLMHDITLMAQSFNPGGLLPSKGLDISHAERVFQQAGMFPYQVAKLTRENVEDPSFFRQLVSYVDSGFPLFAAMYGKRHALAIIGYELKVDPPKRDGLSFLADQVESLIVVDDNHLPYLPVSHAIGERYGIDDIDSFIVPLPEKVFYPGDAVERLYPTIEMLKDILTLPASTDTVFRYFLMTASSLRDLIRQHESATDPLLLRTVMELELTRFVWIIELASRDNWNNGKFDVRVIVDATASLHEHLPFWLIHDKNVAVIFDRSKINLYHPKVITVPLTGMGEAAMTRARQNLRPIQPK